MFFYVNDVKLRCFFDSFGVPMNLVFLVSFECFIWMFCGFIWCSYEIRRMPQNIRLYFAFVDSMILLRPNKVHHFFFFPGVLQTLSAKK